MDTANDVCGIICNIYEASRNQRPSPAGQYFAESGQPLSIVDFLPYAAGALGLGAAAVKTHPHRLSAKTGSSRQADLVRLIACYSHPLTS
jgi:hypothetical protein